MIDQFHIPVGIHDIQASMEDCMPLKEQNVIHKISNLNYIS